MRAVVQRVHQASVEVKGDLSGAGDPSGAIDGGLLVYLGVEGGDGQDDVTYIADKVRHLRVFPDDDGRMNLDVLQAGGKVLVVSAFTVAADARHGRRPAFTAAAPPDRARIYYELLCDALSRQELLVERGSFGAYMAVRSVNDGPICILLDSRRTF